MSRPAPGLYHIVNSIVDKDSNRLALTFNAKGGPLTVAPLVTSEYTQVWNIKDYDSNTQSVSPQNDLSLQIAFGQNSLTTLPAGGYVWNIRGNCNANYTFQDGGKTVYWYLDTAKPQQNVTTNSVNNNEVPTEFWYLYPAN